MQTSRGLSLRRLLLLKEEIVFLTEPEFAVVFSNWCTAIKDALFVRYLKKLKDFYLYAICFVRMSKLNIWKDTVKNGSLEIFSPINNFIIEKDISKALIGKIILD